MMRRAWVFALCLLALGGCSDRRAPFNPRSFDRPGAIAFTCFDEATSTFTELGACRRATADGPYSLTALVTQTGRGEVAAIDLTEERIIDADVRVPGFTFTRVGETPLALAVRRDAPSYTYVASFGSRRIQAVPTEFFRPDAGATGRELHQIDLPGGPTDLVLSRDERFLLATVPEAGLVVQIALDDDGALGERRDFALSLPTPMEPEPDPDAGPTPEPSPFDGLTPVDLTTIDPLPATADPAGYEKLCSGRGVASVPASAPVPPRTPVGQTESRPVALVLDSPGRRVLVADEALPVVHVLSLGDEGIVADEAGEATNAPLVVGVPTRALALSPVVPATLGADPMTAPARYLYAIDAIDQSVIVVDYERSSPSFGAVLPVGFGIPPIDRIRFVGGVRAIEVVTPSSGGDACLGPESESFASAGPLQLRGVFLVAGLNDGSIRVIDIHDLDAPCRGGVDCIGPPPNDNDQVVNIRRHRPRIGTFQTTNISVSGTPTFTVEGRTARILPTGVLEGIQGTGLAPLSMGCPEAMTRIYPTTNEGSSLICALSNVWTVRAEQWTAAWNGAVPGTIGRRGRIEGSTLFADDANFCVRGVLGSANLPTDADAPEALYEGDDLEVVSDLPESTRNDAECVAAFDRVTFPRFVFPIVSAQNGALELGQAEDGPSLALLDRCFPELLTYEVRTQGAFAVSGNQSGFLHRVIATEDGTCAVDPTASPLLQGRALPDRDFVNTLVAFRVLPLEELEDRSLRYGVAQVDFGVGNLPTTVFARPGDIAGRPLPILPSALRFNTIDGRLYVVDMASRGVLPFDLQPFRLRRTTYE